MLSSFLGEGKGKPSVYTEENDEQGLDGVYDEHEEEGVCRLDAVQDEHCLHGEMPRSGTVWRRHDDGDASHDEGHQSAHQS